MTPIPKSAAQLRKEARIRAQRKARSCEDKPEEQQEGVKVYRVDFGAGAKFGEMVEPNPEVVEIVPATTFSKKKRRKAPRLKLTTKQREAIFNGEYPHIAFPRFTPKRREQKLCPVEVEKSYPLSAKVSITVTGITIKKEEFVIHYAIRDDRPRLLRREVRATDFDAMRQENQERRNGKQVAPIDEAAAAEGSAYTSSTHAAMTDEGEAVPRDYQRRLSEQAALKANFTTPIPGIFQRQVMKAEQEVADQRMQGKTGVLAEAAAERARKRAAAAATE